MSGGACEHTQTKQGRPIFTASAQGWPYLALENKELLPPVFSGFWHTTYTVTHTNTLLHMHTLWQLTPSLYSLSQFLFSYLFPVCSLGLPHALPLISTYVVKNAAMSSALIKPTWFGWSAYQQPVAPHTLFGCECVSHSGSLLCTSHRTAVPKPFGLWPLKLKHPFVTVAHAVYVSHVVYVYELWVFFAFHTVIFRGLQR